MPVRRAACAAARAAAASSPDGTRNCTLPSAAPSASAARSVYPPVMSASQAGRATPCSSPAVCRTLSTRWLTHGMPSLSAPARPARRSTARSTETVVCVLAISTIGWPALAASSRASRTIAGSRLSRVCILLPRFLGVLGDAALKDGPDTGLGPDDVERELCAAGHVTVAHQHRHIGG